MLRIGKPIKTESRSVVGWGVCVCARTHTGMAVTTIKYGVSSGVIKCSKKVGCGDDCTFTS